MLFSISIHSRVLMRPMLNNIMFFWAYQLATLICSLIFQIDESNLAEGFVMRTMRMKSGEV